MCVSYVCAVFSNLPYCHTLTDKSKYGYRMLQAMGWREGQGLGRDESGRTEHVKISRRKDNSGTCSTTWCT